MAIGACRLVCSGHLVLGSWSQVSLPGDQEPVAGGTLGSRIAFYVHPVTGTDPREVTLGLMTEHMVITQCYGVNFPISHRSIQLVTMSGGATAWQPVGSGRGHGSET